MSDMSDKQALCLFEKCVNELYAASKPPTTWRVIKKKYGGTGKSFHDKHIISEESYDEIRDKYFAKLPKYYQKKLSWFLLDFAPTIGRIE